ncbi:energy transducer TonB [Salinibacter ruber]|uniref:energy transducer TonB n=1 Tax=Salinibacter ruber TaxID=146919 RepID=UPI002168EC1D|nr:energy transducer TonB [Salinibacter ruber]MCS4102364.1 TonB family protein [Salinibacter ruber]
MLLTLEPPAWTLEMAGSIGCRGFVLVRSDLQDTEFLFRTMCKRRQLILLYLISAVILYPLSGLAQVESEVDKYKGVYIYKHDPIELNVVEGRSDSASIKTLVALGKMEDMDDVSGWVSLLSYSPPTTEIPDPENAYFLADGERVVVDIVEDSTYEQGDRLRKDLTLNYTVREFRGVACAEEASFKIAETVFSVSDTLKKRMRTIFTKAPPEFTTSEFYDYKCTAKSSNKAKSDEENEEEKESDKAKKLPTLIGGMKSLQESAKDLYPKFAKKAGIEGRVIVEFSVDDKGNVQRPMVTRGVHRQLNEAAIEAVKKQEFKPGTQQGEPVRMRISLPVLFRLQP